MFSRDGNRARHQLVVIGAAKETQTMPNQERDKRRHQDGEPKPGQQEKHGSRQAEHRERRDDDADRPREDQRQQDEDRQHHMR